MVSQQLLNLLSGLRLCVTLWMSTSSYNTGPVDARVHKQVDAMNCTPTEVG